MISFTEDIVKAAGDSHPLAMMIEVILRYKAAGYSQQDVYDKLQGIWRELRCDVTTQESPLCNLLESVMDRVWGYCRREDAIWTAPL